jgi:hypothetical protein
MILSRFPHPDVQIIDHFDLCTDCHTIHPEYLVKKFADMITMKSSLFFAPCSLICFSIKTHKGEAGQDHYHTYPSLAPTNL